MNDMNDKEIKKFIPWVDALAETFGKNCEVVLHDLCNLDRSIVKIANGHITGRDVGAPITDMGLRLFEENKQSRKDTAVIGYRTRTKEGRELKSTTLFIRNDKGDTVGCLCINIDLTPYLSTKNLIDQLCQTASRQDAAGENGSPEKFLSDVDSLMEQLIEKAVKKVNKPIVSLSKADKLQMMRDLKKEGFFLIKGSVKKLSGELGISVPTTYKYLEEI
ncbi:MAG: YheO-like PAS domain protein [Syntrophaceae bacterium PtaU1.Bin231]|nr:MAG: YheO-like PAS domain protein [Syntrophaceae bacterium PtaU1.Bin231]HOG17928.1 PAS domain-containing protein [Syntrophales bacterium]